LRWFSNAATANATARDEDNAMSRNRWPQVVSAFAIGLGAGAALGVLFAPQSGEDTRDYLRGTAQDSVDEAIASGKKAARRVRKHIGEATEFANDVAETAEGAFRDARKAAS
jgi:gas vesicle protein